MRIGIIGSGEMGTCLASKFAKLGHTVSIANSRGPVSLKQLADDIGAKAATVEEVTKNKKVIVVSIPQKNVQDIPKSLFKNLPEDVVVIDTGNYYPTLRDGTIPALDQSGIDSLWFRSNYAFLLLKFLTPSLRQALKIRPDRKVKKIVSL